MRRSLSFLLMLLAAFAGLAQSPGIWKQTGIHINQTDLQAQKAKCLPNCSFTGHADEDGMQYRYAHLGADRKTHVYSGHVRFDWQSAKGTGTLLPGETVRVIAYVTNTGDAGTTSGYVTAGRNGFMTSRSGQAYAGLNGTVVMVGTFVVPKEPAQKPDGTLIPTWDITFVLTGGNETRYIERIVTYTWQPVTGQTGKENQSSGSAIKTDRTNYGDGEQITVLFSGLPGNNRDWIGIYRAGTDGRAYLSWQYTQGKKDGRLVFTPPSAGEYILIAYENDGYRELGRSTVVQVGSRASQSESPPGTAPDGPGVVTDKAVYRVGESITVQFTGISGYPQDWIGIYHAQAYHANEYIEWKYTEGRKSGSMTFASPRSGAGSYIFRVYENNGYKLLAQSPVFKVVD